MEPALNALMRRRCANTLGGALVTPAYGGTIARVVPHVRQVFSRVATASLAAADDDRLAYFSTHVLPELEAGMSDAAGRLLAHTLLFVPSYFDYVRLRNALDAREMEFVTACEYTEDGDVTRARARFFSGDAPLLLMTERFHFFRRLRIRGARHIIFYAPPQCHWFYDEILNWLEEAAARREPVSATLLFTRYDALALERIVGSDRVAALLDTTAKPTFVFM